MPRMNLEGSSSIVTGGASGIGEACARQLADLGSRGPLGPLGTLGTIIGTRGGVGGCEVRPHEILGADDAGGWTGGDAPRGVDCGGDV